MTPPYAEFFDNLDGEDDSNPLRDFIHMVEDWWDRNINLVIPDNWEEMAEEWFDKRTFF